MVTNIQQESTVAHYSNREDDGVLQSYDSIGSLVNDIKATATTMFEGLSLVNNVNYLNGYKLITDFHLMDIKKHFREIGIVKIKAELAQNGFAGNENVENKADQRQRGITDDRKIKMRDLQKGYMQMLSV